MVEHKIFHSLFIVFIICLSLFVAPLQAADVAESKINLFESLQNRLVRDGFDKSKIAKIYNNRQVFFNPKGIVPFVHHKESVLNYDQFTSERSIQKAKKYVKTYKTELLSAEKTYRVDKNIIVAIILVETRLGLILGKRALINTLSTMASLSENRVRETLWEQISSSSTIKKEKFEAWSKRKSKWAYAELKAFLKHTDQEKINPVNVYGSYAGAMGIAQFMPSNIIAYAKDGNHDGRIDLFNHADAIASIGSYLKHFGWKPNVDKKKAFKVLYHYNHSNYYVNTILKVAELLKG